MIRLILHFFFILYIYCFLCTAQSSDITFRHLTIQHGLSQNSGRCMVQDKAGYIWIGTHNGLNKYDGYTFTVFTFESKTPHSISCGQITDLCKDGDRFFWVGTERGLNRFDLSTERFTHYLHDPNEQNCLSNDRIYSVCKDRDGATWVGTENGLNRLEIENNRFTHYYHDQNDTHSLSHSMILVVYQDREGTLWIGTDGGGLNRFNRATNTFTRYKFGTESTPSSERCNHVSTLYEDQQRILWVGTLGGGLFSFNKEQEKFTQYTNDPKDKASLSNDYVTMLFEDSKGTIWIGTENGGINHLDRSNNSFISYTNDPKAPYSLSGNHILSMVELENNELWIGTSADGINIYNRQSQAFSLYRHLPHDPNSLSDNQIWGLHEDKKGILWIGTDQGGLNCFDPNTKTFHHYMHDPNIPGSLCYNKVIDVIEDLEGNIWAGTFRGLDRMDVNSGTFTHFFHEPNNPNSLSNDKVICLHVDKDGLLWVGTKGGGLNTYNSKTNQFVHYVYDSHDSTTLNNNFAYCILEDRFENLWIGTKGGGLNKFDRKSNTFSHYQPELDNPQSINDNFVYSLCEARSGDLWIGTSEGGLNKYSYEEDRFTHYTKREGLTDNTIYGIIEDDRGNLWISTTRGLARFNPQSGKCNSYNRMDRIQSNEFDMGSFCKSRTGQFYFGGINGFNAFYPDSIKDNQYIPPIVITQFQLFNKPISVGKTINGTIILPKTLAETKKINLSHRENIFSFEFAALNYLDPENNQYAYMLEGVDREWNYVGNRRFATYTSLAPGNYVFKVKGSNNDGLWNEVGTDVEIAITPPYWAEPWFKFFALLLLTGLGVFFYKMRTRAIRQTMAKQKLENELRLKADFTAMLVHDLRSPLQCVLGYTDLMEFNRQGKQSTRMENIVKKSVNMMIELINDMLDISKFEANKMVIKRKPIVLVDIFDDIANLMEPLLIEKNLTLERVVECDGSLQGDDMRIGRVINNLMSNAIKFSPNNETITVTLRRKKSDDSDYLEFTIRDMGSGIDPRKRKHLFNAYAQVEDKSGLLPVGTGLGLAVSRMSIEAHGGRIGYRDAKFGGSEFYFLLPIQEDNE